MVKVTTSTSNTIMALVLFTAFFNVNTANLVTTYLKLLRIIICLFFDDTPGIKIYIFDN